MDWIASGLVLLGNFIIGRKNKWGWIVVSVSALFWMWYAVFHLYPPQWGLLPASIVNLVIAVASFYKWNKEDNGF